ncbi:MAG: glycosyl hydrolase family 8 [Acidimicrobiales bacterium]
MSGPQVNAIDAASSPAPASAGPTGAPPGPPRSVALVLLASMVAAALLAWALVDTSVLPSPSKPVAPATLARDAVSSFFNRYVQPSGRVVRWDQGGDTVSEGQAYAMLLAAATGNRQRFSSVWKWTKSNLGLSDGLFGWHWSGGHLLSHQSAADADVYTAWALAIASARFHDTAYASAAKGIAGAILAHEMTAIQGKPVLVAGPWALTPPITLNPSYFQPRAFSALGSITGNPTWSALSSSSLGILSSLSHSGSKLPPSWATMSSSGTVAPETAPNQAGKGHFGLNAARVPAQLASACSARATSLAASMWRVMAPAAGSGRSLTTSLSLSGSPTGTGGNAAMYVGAAGAAKAAGKTSTALELLAQGQKLNKAHPTYYGSAWLALGRVMLSTSWLGACPAQG